VVLTTGSDFGPEILGVGLLEESPDDCGEPAEILGGRNSSGRMRRSPNLSTSQTNALMVRS
jgi:hypothetical protein